MASEMQFCWFCRTKITDPMVENPDDAVHEDITCRDCHSSRRDMLYQVYIPFKTLITIANRDWRVWTEFLELNKEAEIEELSRHLSARAAQRLHLAVSETHIGDHLPEDEQGVSTFELEDEYVPTIERLEAALQAQMADIKSGEASTTDRQLEYLLALDLQI